MMMLTPCSWLIFFAPLELTSCFQTGGQQSHVCAKPCWRGKEAALSPTAHNLCYNDPAALPASGRLHRLVQSLAALPPVKGGAAFRISGFLQCVEPLDIIDRRNNAVSEIAHRCKRKIVEPRCERQAGNSALDRRDGHAVEDIVEGFELEAAAGSLGDNADPDAAENRLRVVDEAKEAGRRMIFAAAELVGHLADDVELDFLMPKEVVGDCEELR